MRLRDESTKHGDGGLVGVCKQVRWIVNAGLRETVAVEMGCNMIFDPEVLVSLEPGFRLDSGRADFDSKTVHFRSH